MQYLCISFTISDDIYFIMFFTNILVNSRLDKKQTVAFSACLGSSGRTYGPHQPIEFDSVLLNEGSAYDPRHGIFRAPFGGFYHFAVNFLSAPPESSYIEIVRDGNQLVYSYAAGDGYNLGSTQVNIRLEAGQDVWCRNGLRLEQYLLIPMENTRVFQVISFHKIK